MKILLSSCLLAASAAMLAGCHESAPTPQTTVETVSAHVVESQQQPVSEDLRATGTVHAKETAVISAQVMGRIQQVLVHEGDSVRPGQTLAVLDDSSMRAALSQAQAAVKAAENQQAAAASNAKLAASTLDRYKQLQTQKSVSPQEMDEVSRRAEAAAAQLDAAQAQAQAARDQAHNASIMLSYTRLVAPFAGVVTARMADPGTMAAPGVPLLQIDRTGALQLQASVDESGIGVVRRGRRVPVTIGGALPGMQGTVAEIVPAADPASHSFLVKIDLPASNQLRPGMYGTADFTSGTRQAIVVPRSAVIQRGSLVYAYVLDGQGIAQLRYLTLGAAHGDLVEVLSGISPDEKLVDQPLDRDFAGPRIEVEP
jgi:RND family efflux transporter MFP subunit